MPPILDECTMCGILSECRTAVRTNAGIVLVCDACPRSVACPSVTRTETRTVKASEMETRKMTRVSAMLSRADRETMALARTLSAILR
jgi:ribosome-binding protein aMBF1 (putative translation factor)